MQSFESAHADGTGLSPAGVKGIIAACVIGFVLLIALMWFIFDIVHIQRKVRHPFPHGRRLLRKQIDHDSDFMCSNCLSNLESLIV